MLFQLLFGKNKKKGFITPDNAGTTDIIGLELDAIVLESPDYTATPTRSQVESGADITDHVTLSPEKLSIEGIVTNTPIGLFQSLKALTTQNAAQDAFDFLLKLYTERQPFNFVGGFKVYEDMVITNFSPSRTPTTGGVLQFRMSMEQIRFVESEVVAITKFKAPVKHQGAKKQSLGSQPTQTASAKAQSKGASVLAKWLPNFLN
jgi:hypothetical protein